MGARPLRRAVERHLLAPLARVIATHQAPRGEQFLFVSSESDRLDVRFVAAGDTERPADEETPATSAQSARDVAREGRGRRADLRVLRDTLSTLRELTGEAHWHERKGAALAATSDPGFWDRDDRFAVLGLAETMDRIEAQLGSCASLLDRLFALAPGEDVRIDPGPVARLARELVQLDRAMQSIEADRAQDALVELEADDAGQPFAVELVSMYQAWARLRGARATVIDVHREPGVTYLHVEGLGAFDALARDHGLHVYESRRDGRAERHALVRVTVMPWTRPAAPAAGSSLTRVPRDTELAVVRRYQREPSPLVRDVRAGWRTGRIERVLGGDFDLYGTE
jgi:ATP-dependent Clp protease ATP-binding subunit ClpC